METEETQEPNVEQQADMDALVKAGAQSIVDGKSTHDEVVNIVSDEHLDLGHSLEEVGNRVMAEVHALERAALDFPLIVLIKKYGDKIAVEVRSVEHFDRLVAAHGHAGLEVAK